MTSINRLTSSLGRTAVLAGLVLVVAIGIASIANAGECPAGKMGANKLSDAASAPKNVTDNVIGSIDLAKEGVKLNEHQFRLRRLEIKPGGVVPHHSHGDRPALIYVVSGQVTEYSSDCLAPIVHKAGEVSAETHEVDHWWKNTGSETVVLLSADILHDPSDKNM